VLYMHDGQMLFDSTATWNKQEWKVDEVLTQLIREQRAQPCIVVAVWNNGRFRHSEYFPQNPLYSLPTTLRDSIIAEELQGKAQADEYLKFLVIELKPFIDRTFAVHTGPSHTFVAGSSMGGLISLYALCEYPNTFSGAACLSTHWIGSLKRNNDVIAAAFQRYLADYAPAPHNHRIYFDYGTATLDSLYKRHQLVVDKTMKRKRFTYKNWMTREFVGAAHTEQAWSARLDIPLRFLLRP
jgi:predicted alpha/beta superfamily hydrolase